ncbi:MAG TPA: hypothetical protein VK465_08660 [Fibrobacteria bacterium]|nr:hypothetical protein [Fibrobacteria bacterium]
MEKIDKFWAWLDGKKRGIGAVGGVLGTWAATYDMLPEKWLALFAALLTLWTGVAIQSASRKK